MTYGPYVWKTYKQADVDRKNFGAGLLELYQSRIPPSEQKKEWFLGLFSVNRYEWVIAEVFLTFF